MQASYNRGSARRSGEVIDGYGVTRSLEKGRIGNEEGYF
jgi:hypothetical protein